MTCFALLALLNVALQEQLDLSILNGGSLVTIQASDSETGMVVYHYDEALHLYCREPTLEG